MEIQYVREFLSLAETGSFFETAEQLFVTTSSLSRHIKALESEMGVTLFDRTTRKVTLNRYGKLFLPFAKEFARIDGVDQAGNTLWHLETKHYPAAQLMQCSDIGICNDLYYYAEGGAVITLDLTNGSQVWKNEDFHGSSANGVFDEDGTLYLSGYYRPDLFVTDRAGRTICRKDKLTEDDSCEYYIIIVNNAIHRLYLG